MSSPSEHPAPTPANLAPRAVVDGVARWAGRLEAVADTRRAAGDFLALMASSAEATRGSLMLVNPRSARLHILAGLGLPEGCVGEDLPPAPRRISDWVVRECRAIVINGEVRDKRFEASAKHSAIASAMCLPLRGRRGVIGVVNLARTEPSCVFAPRDVLSVEAVTPAIAAILDRIIELELARPLWRQFAHRPILSPWPSPRAGEIAFSLAEGLGPNALVCEHYVREDGTVLVMLAEPLGITARAIRVGEWLRGMFRSAASRGLQPASFATKLHGLLPIHQPGGGARVWLAAFGANGSLRSCSAGYPPPFCLLAAGESGQRLVDGGPALGSEAGKARYSEAQVRLLPGDAVVVVNEGLLRSRSAAGQPFGDAGVLEQLQDHRHRPLESVVEALTGASRSHAGLGLTPDDMMAFGLRFKRRD